jgi:hypothetical protein
MKKRNVLTISFVLIFFVILEPGLLSGKQPAAKKIPNELYFGQSPPGNSPELFAPGIISTGANELSITISPDLKEIYVSRSSPNWATSIVMFKKTSTGWSGPELAPFIKGLGDVYPFYSAKDNAIFFNSERPVPGVSSAKHFNPIWMTKKTSTGWSDPRILSEKLDLTLHMSHPSVSKKGNIYFNSTMEDSIGQSDIYCLEKAENGYGKIRNLGPAINSEHQEFHPFIAPDESYIIFDKNHPEGFGRNDLYISFKKSNGEWATAVNMGDTINTRSSDMRAFVSPDGKFLFFCSMRPNHQDSLDIEKPAYQSFSNIIYGPGNGSQDIYWVGAEIITKLKKKCLKQ